MFKRIFSFSNLIYFSAILFVGYHISSLYQIDIINISINIVSSINFIIITIILLIIIALMSYYLPVVLVIEIYQYYLNFKFNNNIESNPVYNKRCINNNIIIDFSMLYLKLNVIRC